MGSPFWLSKKILVLCIIQVWLSLELEQSDVMVGIDVIIRMK